MSVTIREWKGAWWIFINHHGTRKAKRIGTGAVGKKAAKQAAQQIQARLALGQTAFDRPQTGVTLEAYVETFLERIEQTRKHTTHADYRKIFDHYVFPVFKGQELQQITREKGEGLRNRVSATWLVGKDRAEHHPHIKQPLQSCD